MSCLGLLEKMALESHWPHAMVSGDPITPKVSVSFADCCRLRTLAGEIEQDYETLLEGLRKDFTPHAVLEHVFVNQMATDFGVSAGSNWLNTRFSPEPLPVPKLVHLRF
jgi:hypothetical protein